MCVKYWAEHSAVTIGHTPEATVTPALAVTKGENTNAIAADTVAARGSIASASASTVAIVCVLGWPTDIEQAAEAS